MDPQNHNQYGIRGSEPRTLNASHPDGQIPHKPHSANLQLHDLRNYTAVNLRGFNSYDKIVQLVGAQTKDPVAGLMCGDKSPTLNATQPEPADMPVEDKEILFYMEANGIDPASGCGDTTLAA